MPKKCLVCSRITDIINKNNPYFVTELKTGYVVLGDYQFYKGYTIFLSKKHKAELHQLDKNFKLKFLQEMSEVAEAVYQAFRPKKLNYELLGNLDNHMHWHIFPRYQNDPQPNLPIWCLEKNIRCSEEAKLSQKELEILKKKLLHFLKNNK